MAFAGEVVDQAALRRDTVEPAESSRTVVGKLVDEVCVGIAVGNAGESGVDGIAFESASLQLGPKSAGAELLAAAKPVDEVTSEGVIIDETDLGQSIEFGIDNLGRQVTAREQVGHLRA